MFLEGKRRFTLDIIVLIRGVSHPKTTLIFQNFNEGCVRKVFSSPLESWRHNKHTYLSKMRMVTFQRREIRLPQCRRCTGSSKIQPLAQLLLTLFDCILFKESGDNTVGTVHGADQQWWRSISNIGEVGTISFSVTHTSGLASSLYSKGEG